MIMRAFGKQRVLPIKELRSKLIKLFEAENKAAGRFERDAFKQAIGSVGGASRHHTICISNGIVTLLV